MGAGGTTPPTWTQVLGTQASSLGMSTKATARSVTKSLWVGEGSVTGSDGEDCVTEGSALHTRRPPGADQGLADRKRISHPPQEGAHPLHTRLTEAGARVVARGPGRQAGGHVSLW